MHSTSPAATTGPDRVGAWARLAVALASVFLMLAGQSVPGLAGQDRNRPVMIEICAADGAGRVLVGGAPMPDDCRCVDCTCCLSGGAVPAGPIPGGEDARAPLQFALLHALADRGIVPAAAEQYWAAPRGPPNPNPNTGTR